MTNVDYTSDRVNVVRSQWGYKGTAYGCMNCGFGVIAPIYNYCPNCGAKMGEDVVGKTDPDLVNVVRCRDCRHWHEDIGATTKWLMCHEIVTDRNWFCADGERRDER